MTLRSECLASMIFDPLPFSTPSRKHTHVYIPGSSSRTAHRRSVRTGLVALVVLFVEVHQIAGHANTRQLVGGTDLDPSHAIAAGGHARVAAEALLQIPRPGTASRWPRWFQLLRRAGWHQKERWAPCTSERKDVGLKQPGSHTPTTELDLKSSNNVTLLILVSHQSSSKVYTYIGALTTQKKRPKRREHRDTQ